MTMTSLIIHAGAGGTMDNLRGTAQENHKALHIVLERGRAALAARMSAMDAAELCVRLLEDNPLFNAGCGAVATATGQFELDASIMDGRDLKAGAVACVRNIRNPVSLARLVMEKTPHVLLVARGAMNFANSQDIPQEPDSYFQNALDKAHAGQKDAGTKHGTVGAVALDCEGNIAAATSTGGTADKMDGRVGDTPLVGAGTWADNRCCGVSCTGIGEHFIRTALAHRTAMIIEKDGVSAQDAAALALTYLQDMIPGGEGGLIALDKQGRIGFAHKNDILMRFGYIEHGGQSVTALSAAEAAGKL